jgi:tight adherence protein C
MWVGSAIVLSRIRWFSRPRLVDRLRPYGRGDARVPPANGVLSVASFREIGRPFARAAGDRLARLLGVGEELAVRLERIHADIDATTFRVRQIGWTIIGLGLAMLVTAVVRPPLPGALVALIGGPVFAFLIVEQQLVSRSAGWQRRVFLELPVVSEQLAMLLSAGYSLGAALNRLADRGTGACARDLTRVCGRIRQGLTEVSALREWAAIAQVPALDRLVPVLALNREASDLGRLVSDEARAIRRDVQRGLIETMDRRAQQVWIPVTVATLVPGVIFLCIPFIEALRQFAGP